MDQFSLVFICTGNRFRSPLAEAFVRRLTLGYPVAVESFATFRVGAAPALPEAVALGRWCNVDLSEHRARLVGTTSLANADLVVGFEEEHVRRAVVDAAAPRRRSFGLREIVGLAADASGPTGDLVPRARAVVDRAALRRDAGDALHAAGSIRDPFGKSWRVYRETAEEVRVLSVQLVRELFGIADAALLPPIPPRLTRWTARRVR